jgi:oligopeptidase A
MSTSDNPLIQSHTLPPFTAIKPEHVLPAVEQLIEHNKTQLAKLLEQPASWQSLIQPMEAFEDQLSQAWSPVSHLNGVMNSDELRAVYTEAVQKLTAYGTEMGQHEGLYQAYKSIAESDEFGSLDQAQQQTITNALRDFTLSGIGLPKAEQEQFAANQKRLSELATQFSNNVLDATHGWYKHIQNEQELAGLPPSAIALAAQAARGKDLEGWVITLDIPSYLAVMTYAENRTLREELYRAYATRASDLGVKTDGSSAAQWDNRGLIDETLALRQAQAELLGFASYAQLSLARKMAETPDQVETFLLDLASQSRTMAQSEYQQLQDFAQSEGLDELKAWDVSFYSERLKQAQHKISEEELKPYFPAEKVVSGMFAVANRLFDLTIERDASVSTWHPDASYYTVTRAGQVIAGFYLDLFAREHKRGGAWMDECRVRRQATNGLQLPVAYLTCNFNPPSDSHPSLLTFNEVTTLFHEFGHGLHHMLTEIDVAAVSGINGVAWDAVELPSQFLENWCWQEEVIGLISGHFETGEALPNALLQKMLAAKNFQSGMQMLRQIEFALFDLRLHRQHPVDVRQVLAQVRNQVAVVQPPEFNRFENGFSHIFAGGYAAGYYSYKWAEVLSADAFSVFEEKGIFDRDSGQRFLTEILQAGGSRDAAKLFKAFRGREPSIGPLLRHSGIK